MVPFSVKLTRTEEPSIQIPALPMKKLLHSSSGFPSSSRTVYEYKLSPTLTLVRGLHQWHRASGCSPNTVKQPAQLGFHFLLNLSGLKGHIICVFS